jgi:hypothetical protein
MAIGKPKFDTRPGVTAATTARLWICATLCIIQYWLLTASMEAFHGGNRRVAIPMFLASGACFLLTAGLIITGESGARKLQDELKKDQ